MENKTKLTSIQVNADTRSKLMILKQKLGCRNVEEVIERILGIITKMKLAGELKKWITQ